jgi:SagB-type dehydrogenase family enzyme
MPMNGHRFQSGMRHAAAALLGILLACSPASAQPVLKTIHLPQPDTSGGMPLMQALKHRKTSRSFSDRPLPQQVISNLLWAAFGVNRPDGHRTAPSARNWQEIDVYMTTADGLFRYDAGEHALLLLSSEDLRARAGVQDFVATAPVNLVYVADLKKINAIGGDDQAMYTGADCGFIAQNVYLYCASEGLAAVVRAMIDRPALAKAMKLLPDQKIILSQTIGYPKE